jgi:PAS domain S-box-containing protein
MLTHSAELISKGNFSIQIKESSTNDEISILQRSFRIMASNLKSLITRLNNYNKKLESVVEERTMELKISEQKYKGLYNSSKDGIFYLDMENTFENANFAFIELTGYSSRELKKMKLEDLEEKKSDKIKEVLNEIKQKGFSHEIEVNILHKSGSIIPVAIHAWLLKNNTGTSEGIWGFGRDISERKFAENIREDVERMIRHDIKSPLNGIIGLSNIILEHDTIDDANIKNLESIIELSLNTIQLIENSLKMHRIESGNYQLEAEDCDLISMLLKYKTEYSLMIKEKIIGLEYFYENKNFYEDSNITCFVRGEKILLNLLFGNLLKNAIEASPKNETITINIIQTDNEIRININNQGVIPKSIRPKFFEKYTSSGKKNGTGLGTFSSKLIAKVHKGDITFETSPTKGTTLIVSLPASNIEKIIDSQSIENDILEKDPNNSNLFLRNQRLNVLVVDDSTTNRFIMKQAIQSLTKWIPYFAVNGQEAITSFQSHSIDVVLMDMYMPDYNGDVAIQKIREIEKGNNHINRVCIIVISADTTNWIEGADGYVSKSFNSIDQFIDDIIRIINLGVSQKN